jgi:uncharacterized protein
MATPDTSEGEVVSIDLTTTTRSTAWRDALGPINPDLIAALERTGSASVATGWTPAHLGIHRDDRLVAFMPLYLKDHSAGEFFFDWSWAHAMIDAGHGWYPKMVSALPFMPLAGPRLMCLPTATAGDRLALARSALDSVEKTGANQLQVLFHDPAETDIWRSLGALPRTQIRYVWRDRGFGDFDGYLGALKSRRRKSIRRERSKISGAGLEFRWCTGGDLSEPEWERVHACYARTYALRGQAPYFRRRTLTELAATLGQSMPILTVRREGLIIATGLCIRSKDTLYGRHWGALEDLPGLHFEACYYRGIEFCLRHGLTTFDPGVQGDHKLLRGFLPEQTYAAYWFQHANWRDAFEPVLDAERAQVRRHLELARAHDPYRDGLVEDAGPRHA